VKRHRDAGALIESASAPVIDGDVNKAEEPIVVHRES
jgi:hypothetical protein